MFSHIFKMRLKFYFREKTIVFWLIAFPVILATFFNIALTGILDNEKMKNIGVAIVTDFQVNDFQVNGPDSNLNNGIEAIFNSIKNIEYFDVKITDKENASKLLEEGSIDGIVLLSYDKEKQSLNVSLEIKENGMAQTILKETTDIIHKNIKTTTDIILAGSTPVYDFSEIDSYVKDAFKEENKPDTVVTFFYTVLGMACAYGAMTGVTDTEHIQANLSSHGMRQGLSPVPKTYMGLAYFSASAVAQCMALSIVFVYIRFILGVDFGSRIGFVLLTTYIGAVAHVAIGTFIGAVLKCSSDVKIGIILGISMVGSFLSGMMSSSVKYAVYVKAPIVNYINTVNLVCDSYNKLYYYPGLKEYGINMIILSLIGIGCFAGAIIILRRQKYDSI